MLRRRKKFHVPLLISESYFDCIATLYSGIDNVFLTEVGSDKIITDSNTLGLKMPRFDFVDMWWILEELGSLCKPKVEEIGKSICNGMPSRLRIVVVGKECVGLADCEEKKGTRGRRFINKITLWWHYKGEGKKRQRR